MGSVQLDRILQHSISILHHQTDARQDVHRIYDCRQPRIDHTPSRSLYRIIHPILISTLSSTTSVPSASGSSVSPHAAASTTEASGQQHTAEQDHSAHPSTLLPSAVTSPPSIAVVESTSPAIASHQRRRRRSSSSSSSSEEEQQEQDEEQQVTSELLPHQSSSNPTASHPYHQQASTSPLLATSHHHRRVKRQRRHLNNITTSFSAPFYSTSSSEMHSGASMNGNGLASDGHSKLGTSSNGHHLTQEPSSSAVASSSRGKTIYPGSEIDREELVRLTLQCLQDAGYHQSAHALSRESGFVLESPTVTAFRNGVLEGKWETVVRLLQDEHIIEGVDVSTVRFKIAEQKFLEHLEARDTKRALSVLRNELAPLNHNPDRLHQLSSYMMCGTSEELRERSGWLGSGEASRQQLLASLQHLIPASIMIPQRRLETLLEQAKSYQRTQCQYHAADTAISLYADHMCDRSVFPTVTTHVLGGHTDEVWRVEFSHNGAYLATASCDGTVQIWTVKDSFALLHTLHVAEHTEDITSIAWSPDDTMILLGVECAIKMYDVQSGLCTLNVTKHEYCAIGGVTWLPNGTGFFSGGLDMRVLCWDLEGNVNYTFSTGPYRIVDIAVSPDATRLVCLGEVSHVRRTPALNGAAQTDANKGNFDITDRKIITFNLQQRARESMISHNSAVTSVVFAPGDSRHAIVNSAPNEVIMYDVIEGREVKRYTGQTQSGHMIRSCMGGSANGFIISGSEDANIYVWHKSNDRPLEVLSGHGRGCVNDVSWNPASTAMFASAGDDKTVRIWQAPSALPPA